MEPTDVFHRSKGMETISKGREREERNVLEAEDLVKDLRERLVELKRGKCKVDVQLSEACRDGMQTAGEILKENSRSGEIVLQALHCLQEIESLKLRLPTGGKPQWSTEACEIALHHHLGDEKITMASIRLLCELCKNPFVARQVIQATKSVSGVLSAVRSHPNSKPILLGALNFFQSISRLDSCISAFQDELLQEIFIWTKSTFFRDPQICGQLVQLVGNLVIHPILLSWLASDGNAQQVVLEASETLYHLKDKDESFEMAFKICWLFSSLSMPRIPQPMPKVSLSGISTIEEDPEESDFFPETCKNWHAATFNQKSSSQLVSFKESDLPIIEDMPGLEAEEFAQGPVPFHTEGQTIRRSMMRKELARLRQPPSYCTVYDSLRNDCAKSLPDGTLRFESRFESGNLRRSIKVSDFEYDLFVSEDINDPKRRSQWFFFCVEGATPGKAYKLNIVNLKKSDSLYNHGLQPLCYTEWEGGHKAWKRVGSSIAYYPSPYSSWAQQSLHRNGRNSTGRASTQKHSLDEGMHMLTFTFAFEHEGRHFFSMCYPFTYSDLQQYLSSLEAVSANSSQALRRTMLCKTLAGQRCDLITITEAEESSTLVCERPFVLITARVHPGETNSSWLMKGFLDFIISEDAYAQLLRRSFVFKVVPMLNPDGVINGCYRCNLAGVDLNRQWSCPNAKHPTIYRTRSLLHQLGQRAPVILYMDLHGHSRKMDAFTFACEPSAQKTSLLPSTRERVRIFPLLLSRRNPSFRLNACTYKVLQAKEGAARVTAATELGVSNSYTLETSMAGSSGSNHFNRYDFEKLGADIGRALADSLLENEEDLMKDVAMTFAAKQSAQQRRMQKGRTRLVPRQDANEQG